MYPCVDYLNAFPKPLAIYKNVLYLMAVIAPVGSETARIQRYEGQIDVNAAETVGATKHKTQPSATLFPSSL
jgi:hypothetical protein